MYTRKRRPKRKTKRGGAIDWGFVAAISIGVGAAGLLGTSFYLDYKEAHPVKPKPYWLVEPEDAREARKAARDAARDAEREAERSTQTETLS